MEYEPSFVDQLDVDYIAHHGIKGQKWGVRRFQNSDGSLTPKGRKRLAKKEQRTLNNLDRVKVQNIYDIERVEKRAAKKVKKLENKDYRNSRNPFREDLRRASLQKNENILKRAKASKNAVNDAYKEQTQKILNRCKDQHLNVEIKEGGKRWVDTHWRLRSGLAYIPIMRPYDGATKYKVSGLQHDDLYLMHHGIKGQKWGVRRFQNPDGSLTDAGRQRYYTNSQYNKKPMSERYDLKMAAKNNGIKINRHDKISYADITKQPNYDPSTGLLKQTSKMSSAENAAMVNPRAANKSLFHSNREYYVNCTHCTAAYDLRKRGYDVAADSASGFGENTTTIYKMYPNAERRNVDPVLKAKNYVDWKDPNVNENQLFNLWNESCNHAFLDSKGYDKACKQQGEKILNTCESYGPNARGNVLIHLAGGGGHSLAFENDSKGRTTFVDAQTVSTKHGKQYSIGGKGSDYYKDVICSADPYFDAEVLRYDNAKPDYNFMLNNHIINNPEIVTKTDKNGKSQTFKMYQHSSYAFE